MAAISSWVPDRNYPFQVVLEKGELPRRSLVKCDQLMTVAKDRLGKMMGIVEPTVMAQVDSGLAAEPGLTR